MQIRFFHQPIRTASHFVYYFDGHFLKEGDTIHFVIVGMESAQADSNTAAPMGAIGTTDATDCSICLQPLDGATCSTVCNHVYHCECLDAYKDRQHRLGASVHCPLCRGVLVPSKEAHIIDMPGSGPVRRRTTLDDDFDAACDCGSGCVTFMVILLVVILVLVFTV